MTRAVVLGAGIVGASTAFHLTRAGHEVVVVDPGVAGAATDAGAGIITAVSTRTENPALAELAAPAIAYYQDLVAQLEDLGHTDHGYGAVGQLIVAVDGEQERLTAVAEVARGVVERHGTRGIGTPEIVDGATARALCPVLGPVAAALWQPAVARVDGRLFRDRLLDAAVGSGARLVRAPGRLRARGDRVVGVSTPGGNFDGDVVVLAAGAWVAEVAAEVGVLVPVRPQRGQIFHTSLAGYANVPIVNDLRAFYLLSFPGGRIVCGATREDDAGFDHALTVGGIAQTLAAVAEFAPGIRDARWIEGRVGFRPFSPDGLPIIGVPSAVGNLVVGAGFAAVGLTAGPLAGALLARLATGETADVPSALSPDRFASAA
jgi:D-amino-acid dehydrogenase